MRKLSFALVLATAVLFAACHKQTTTQANTTPTTSEAITNADVTQAVTQAVSGSTSGMVTQCQQTALMASTLPMGCGDTVVDVISDTSSLGAIFSFMYNLHYIRICICSGGAPSQYNTTISGSSSYSMVQMSSNDNTNAQIFVSGIQSSAANYVLNETYTRTGTTKSLIIAEHSFSSSLTMTSTNLTISKSANQILSGSAAVQFTGTSKAGTVTHTATITFLGNNQATLRMDNGDASTISW